MPKRMKEVYDEANEIAEGLQTNPHDECAIATQIRARTKGYEIALSKMRQIEESRMDEQDEIDSLRKLKRKTKNELNEIKIKFEFGLNVDKHKTQYTEQNKPETLTNDTTAIAGDVYKEKQLGKHLKKKNKLQQDINDQVESNKIAELKTKVLEDHNDPRFK